MSDNKNFDEKKIELSEDALDEVNGGLKIEQAFKANSASRAKMAGRGAAQGAMFGATSRKGKVGEFDK